MRKPIHEAFRDAMIGARHNSRKDAMDLFLETMKSDTAYLEILARDYFDRNAAVWTVHVDKPGSASFVRRDIRAEREARSRTVYAEMKNKIRDVVLLDMLLPNGTSLRHATGADCAKAGGFFAAVARAIKPTSVVDKHLSERDLQNIRARFFQANAGSEDAA